ncbi:YidC/Oxa1 family membrane protein insertase [Herbiconiux sp. P15]|uniref:YidC/Oxa1 family membrane protein insertase n=1 Tax=Herbiconiux liukaitaii TaxID=3342799 RepID=UPI0035B96A28
MQFLSTLLAPVAGAQAAALAVVVLTVIVRLALIPVGVSQARAQRMRQRLAPRIAELRRRHGKNPERLQRETMALYAEEKASPFAGCLPLLLQAPVLSLVYGVFLLPTVNGHANALLCETLLGAPLGTSFVTALGSGAEPSSVVAGVVILALIAAVALLSRRFTLRVSAAAAAAAGSGGTSGAGARGPGTRGAGARGAGGGRGSTGSDPALPDALAAFGANGSATRILSWLPLITVIFAAFVPLAASLYLLVSTAWTLGERTVLARLIK